MHKIYSRPRMKIPLIFNKKHNDKNKKKFKKIVPILGIILIAFITLRYVLSAILPIFESLCRHEAKSIATIISNEEATKVISKYEYGDLFIIDKDTEENINLIKSNIITINEITSDIAKNIQIELNGIDTAKVKLPVGSFLGTSFFVATGPVVHINIIQIGNVVTNLKSEFIEKGVNQTLHRIYLQVDCNVEIVAPFKNMKEKISNQVLLMENIIMGNTPTNYYNFHGIEGNDLLEMIE